MWEMDEDNVKIIWRCCAAKHLYLLKPVG